ncbi:MAG: hypothetical protein E7G85_08800 [Citrobacter portucalensis]|uniref:hypothetical protein n=1 Tax=Citrobacter freundii TaxID=546 RepID=UPI00290CEF2B|nr:hypothetical protein [Citrobacter portucalensis]
MDALGSETTGTPKLRVVSGLGGGKSHKVESYPFEGYDLLHDVEDKEQSMSNVSRDEIKAMLAANKAEVSAISAEMRREMSEWRAQMRSDMRDVTSAIKTQQESLDKHFSAQEIKLNASLQIQEHKFEKSLGDAKLDIIKWALGIPAIAFTIYKLYGALTGSGS